MKNKYIIIFICTTCFVLFNCTETSENSWPDAVEPSEFIELSQIETHFLYEIPNQSKQEFFFGSIRDVKVVADSTFAVLDDIKKAFHFFSQEGIYKGSTIKEGRGPGELMMPHHNFQVSEKGKISIYDRGLQRISIYKLNEHELSVFKDVKLNKMISSHFLLSNDLLVLYEPKSLQEKESKDRVIISDLYGNIIIDQLAEFEGNEQLILSPFSGNFTMGVSSQYHTKNLVCYQEKTMIYNRSNQIGFRVYDLGTGKVINEVKLNRSNINLPIERREELIDEITDPGITNREQRLRLLAEMPKYYPMVHDIKCDSVGHIWLKVTEDVDQHAWIVFKESGELIGKLDTEFEEKIVGIHKNLIFIQLEDLAGKISLHVHRYNIK